jgi:hypothetical protein
VTVCANSLHRMNFTALSGARPRPLTKKMAGNNFPVEAQTAICPSECQVPRLLRGLIATPIQRKDSTFGVPMPDRCPFRFTVGMRRRSVSKLLKSLAGCTGEQERDLVSQHVHELISSKRPSACRR